MSFMGQIPIASSAANASSPTSELSKELSSERVKEIRKDYITRHKEVSSILFGIDKSPSPPPQPLLPSMTPVRHKSKLVSAGATLTPMNRRRNENSIAVLDQSSPLQDGELTPQKNFLENFWDTIVESVTSPIGMFSTNDPELSEVDEESTQRLETYRNLVEEELDDDISTINTADIFFTQNNDTDENETERREGLLRDRSCDESLSGSSCDENEQDGNEQGYFASMCGPKELNLSPFSRRGLGCKNAARSNYDREDSEEKTPFHSNGKTGEGNYEDTCLCAPSNITDANSTLEFRTPISSSEHSGVSSPGNVEKKRKKKKSKEKEKKNADGTDLLVELRAWRDIELEADESFIRGLRQTRRDLEERLQKIRQKDEEEDEDA